MSRINYCVPCFVLLLVLGFVFVGLFASSRKSLASGEVVAYVNCTHTCVSGVMGPGCFNTSTLVLGWHYNHSDYSVVTADRMAIGCYGCCPELVGTAVQIEFAPDDPAQFLWAWKSGEWNFFTGYLGAFIVLFLASLVPLGCIVEELLEMRKTTAAERARLRTF